MQLSVTWTLAAHFTLTLLLHYLVKCKKMGHRSGFQWR